MKNKILIATAISSLLLLSACETASQKVVTGTSASGSASVLQLQALLIKRKVYLLQLNKQQLTN